MAQSEFLKHQDKNGDLLIDKCEVELPGPEEKVCLDCVPNPKAVLTDWKSLEIDSPRLNERICKYEVAVTTRFKTTGGENTSDEKGAKNALDEKFLDYREEAIAALLDAYKKKEDALSLYTMQQNIEFANWDLEARPNSRLKLLYAVPFDILNGLEDEEEQNESDETDGPVTATFLASELVTMNVRVRKGLNLYSRYDKVNKIMSKEYFAYVDNNKPFDVAIYGDNGFSRSSVMARVLIELDQFLVSRGYNLPGVGRGILKDRVVKLRFNFTEERKLKKLAVYTVGCKEKPIIFSGRKISALNRKESFKNKTAMGYLSRLRDMDRELTAREPEHFIAFLKNNTYPQIDLFNSIQTLEQEGGDQTALSCIGDALAKEGKELGQDILDEVLNVADVLAYQFHKNICKRSEEERFKEMVAMGESFDPSMEPKDYLRPGARHPLLLMAKNQGFRQIETNDNVFVRLCGEYLAEKATGGSLDIREIYDISFNKMKICGLLDLMVEGIECLFKGLTLEQALSQAITAALRAMSVENFGVLFVGLPQEKQDELDALVQQKLASGNLFSEQSNAERLSDATGGQPDDRGPSAPIFGTINIIKPWEDQAYIDAERESMIQGPYEGMTPSSKMVQPPGGTVIRRSLGKDYDNPNQFAGAQTPFADSVGAIQTESKQKFSPDSIMQAYFAALVEVYSDNLLDLLDLMNNFPGAEIISKTIALFDCPRPPLFTPSTMDFLKDIELPFCRNISDITLPRLSINLLLGSFNFDIIGALVAAAKIAIQRAIVAVLVKILVKVCEIIGDAICKAIETAGSLAAGLPELLTGRNTIKDILRESICGPQADEQALDDSVVDMYKMLGGVAPEIANRDKVLAFNEALASSVTRRELLEASMGEPSESFLTLVDNLVEYEFPEFRDAFANKSDIGNFFRNFGNLLPVEFRDQAQDFVNGLDEDDQMPANPSLCASPQQIEEFCSLRSEILEGRASPEQIAELCRPGEQFADLAEILQDGIPKTLADALPPMVSDPGCNNGLLPYETDQEIAATAQVMNRNLDQLRSAFSYDMLGNGPGERNWGLMNMILSDTLGRPFTAHSRKVFNDPGKQQYVDFYVNDGGGLDEDGEDFASDNYAKIERQKGAFPVYIAEWMTPQFSNNGQLAGSVSIGNQIQPDKTTIKDFDDLNLGLRVTPLELPDYGYRVQFEVDYENKQVRFVEKQRKASPDLAISFSSNMGEDPEQGYKFDISAYFADLGNKGNYPTDNVRLKITETIVEDGDKELQEDYLEFLASDSTLQDFEEGFLNQFTRFVETFEKDRGSVSPPIVLMSEMLNITQGQATQFWNSTTTRLYNQMLEDVMDKSRKAFDYGVEFDNLVTSDADYLYPDGSGTLYADYEVDDGEGGTRKLNNKDAVLGISRNQFENPDNPRVIYLDPSTYGGSYLNPPIHILPQKSTGWKGLVDSVFPEISPCKPQRTNVIDFNEIESEMMNSYTYLADDQRLAGDPDCVTEVPYNRILTRQSKAGIQSIIEAACRIHSVQHFIKSIATFSKFKPDFKNNYSDLYASYIVEQMEKGFKDAQQSEFLELFNPFKDEEFWYAFLEQSVQTYGRLLDEGDIIDPPESVIKALIRLNNIQDRYDYPDRKDLRESKKNNEVSIFKTLKNYRNEDALGVVKETEDIAKMVLKEFVKKQLGKVAESFDASLKQNDFIDDTYATNVNYYLLSSATGLVAGSELNLLGELREDVSDDLLTREVKYTNGDEMSLQDGTPYVGYYHFRDDKPMTGEEHNDESEDLNLFAKNVIVAAGGQGIGKVSELMPTGDSPFGLRAYLKTPSGQRSPYDLGEITSQEGNVSDVYPGTLSKVMNEQGRVVGLEGELGLRYGLEFYANISGQMVSVTSVEVDVLDLPLAKLPPLQPSSKEMLCLINNLLDDDRYKAFMKYCLPITKIPSILAIYNDMAFLPSIGENVLPDAEKNKGDASKKPGRIATVAGEEGAEFLTYSPITSKEGWFPKSERANRFGLFVLTWDEWDQVTMRRTNSKIKSIFKQYYNSREFGDEEDDIRVVETNIKVLKERLSFAPGKRILPWWKRRRLRSNPFNAKGELCKNKDE
jgi:hypothetical protein